MSGFLSEMLASVSLFLRQPLESFCDVETHHPGAGHADRLVTLRGEYVSVLRVNGLRTMCSRADVEALAEQQRIELQSLLESSGHAIEGWYISDPDQAGVAVDLLALNGCQQISRMMNVDFDDIINERRRRWPQVMRWEDACYILWTRPAILTREEKKQLAAERKEQIKGWPKVGNGQRFTLRSDLMAGRHDAFVARVQDSMSNLGISTTLLGAAEAVTLARETLYRETAGSGWKPTLVGDRVMARFPDSEKDLDKPEHALWPSLRDQIFNADAETLGGQLATVGDYTYAPVDMLLGPEDPRPSPNCSTRSDASVCPGAVP
ncbi:hypothetical protein [Gluconobacter oxydans]|uniref:hypothetical protein n=1 Tax=Gluconobacter oxydans TaxID=442 RepID=UPI0026475CB5|nr:hypothetical protein [Gluconobacter oxydans]WKE49672.1 hypothetical protein NUJ38_14020 [Gluconobacter oxydans]